MDFSGLVSTPLGYIVPFLGVMTFIVFFHELGHFMVARWSGVRIEAFSIGFGREIFGWNDKHGTRWKIAWLPLGGYVKFAGDENAASMPSADALESAEEGNFHTRPLWKRVLIVAAGPIANFLLAIAIFAATFMIVGVPVSKPVVDAVMANSAAAEAGIEPGDRIVAINGEKIGSFMDLQRIVAMHAGERLKLVIRRGGHRKILFVTPKVREVPDGLGGKVKVGMLGVSHNTTGDFRYERKGPIEALELGARHTWRIIAGTMHFLAKMVMGEADTNQLAGPVSIAQVTAKAASISFFYLMQLAAVLSVSIGFVNLLPIPMLDGGHLLYYLIEAVRGKPLGQSAQELGFKVGLALILTMMAAATFNDIMRLFSS